MSKFASIKVGELVTLVIPVTVKATGLPFNLTGQTSILLRFQKVNSNDSPISKTATYSGDLTAGLVAYTLVAGDWTGGSALSEGTWSVLAEINQGSSSKRFAPGEKTLTLKIESALT